MENESYFKRTRTSPPDEENVQKEQGKGKFLLGENKFTSNQRPNHYVLPIPKDLIVFKHSKKEKPSPVGEQDNLCTSFNTHKTSVGIDWVANAAKEARMYQPELGNHIYSHQLFPQCCYFPPPRVIFNPFIACALWPRSYNLLANIFSVLLFLFYYNL